MTPNNEILSWKADLLLANVYGTTGRIYEAKKIYQNLLGHCPNYEAEIARQISLIDEEAKRILK